MHFAITQPGKPAYRIAVTRERQKEFAACAVGSILHGPICIPAGLSFYFDEEFHNLLPGPTHEWTLKLKFIAEAMLLQGWQHAASRPRGTPLEQIAAPELRTEIVEWIDELKAVRGPGERAAKRALESLGELYDIGVCAHDEHCQIAEALCH